MRSNLLILDLKGSRAVPWLSARTLITGVVSSNPGRVTAQHHWRGMRRETIA